jgi:DNA-binding PadR family transcriptional regulator
LGKPTDLVQGTVDLLILKTIALEPLHGWAIAQRIKQLSDDWRTKRPRGSGSRAGSDSS